MAKLTITYEFDTDNESLEDRQLQVRLNKGLDMAMALWDVRYELVREVERGIENEFKYDAPNVLYHEVLDRIRESITSIFEERGLRIDELIN